MRRKKQCGIDGRDTEIHAAGSVRVIVLQENRQRCDQHQQHAGLHRRPQIPVNISPDKVFLDIGKQHCQHIYHKHRTEALHQLRPHVGHRHIAVAYQPQISSPEIAEDKTCHICQQQHYILYLLSRMVHV